MGTDVNQASAKQLFLSLLKGIVLIVFFILLILLKVLDKVGRNFLSISYGILKPCSKCVYGKSRETLIIVSARGYSRDNEALVVMNYKGKNYYRTGECIGYNKCGKCLEVIDKNLKLQCKWARIG